MAMTRGVFLTLLEFRYGVGLHTIPVAKRELSFLLKTNNIYKYMCSFEY